MLRLFKLVRLLRLLKLFPRLLASLDGTINLDATMLRFSKSVVMLCMMWHMMACAYWFMVRTEYGGMLPCPFRPEITCFVNQCLCYSDITRDASNITVLPESDITWYDPYYPGACIHM